MPSIIINITVTSSPDGLQFSIIGVDKSTGTLLREEQTVTLPLPPLNLRDRSQLNQQYTDWLTGVAKLTIASPPVEMETNAQFGEKCQLTGDRLIGDFKNWINHKGKIETALLRILSTTDYCQNSRNCCFVLHTKTGNPELNLDLQRLPFHAWDAFQKSYPQAEITLSTHQHPAQIRTHKQPKVLVLVGDDPHIDLESIGENIPSSLADVRYWSCRKDSPYSALQSKAGAKADLFQTLRDPDTRPQIILFIGHSHSTIHSSPTGLDSQAQIKIYLNESEFITPDDPNFRLILGDLKDRGLMFAAFISCDGLRIAQKLNNLGIPYLMVSREILPVHVAKKLLDKFLNEATKPGISVHTALYHTRLYLHDEVESATTKDRCPNAASFPVIFQNSEQPPYVFNPVLSAENNLPYHPVFIDRIRLIINDFVRGKRKFVLISIAALALAILISRCALDRTACDSRSQEFAFLTCGSKSILDNYELDNQALQGMKYFAQGNYPQAIIDLEAAWNKNKRNPELLIALNNAMVKNQHSIPVKNIAVLIPANKNIEKYVPISILSAVAEAQREWNQKRRNNDDWLVQVTIANDYNDPIKAHDLVVPEIMKRADILGTVGPYSSYVSEGIVDKYISNKHTLISGTNTSTNLGKKTPYFFRTVNNNNVQVDRVIIHLLRHKINKIELLVGDKPFANTFAQSMQRQAANTIKIHQISIAHAHINPKNDVFKQAANNGSQALVLVPDAFIADDKDGENIRQIITNNNGNIPIIGNEVVNDPWLIEQMEKQPEIAKNLTLSLTWDPSVDRTNISPLFTNVPQWWYNSSHQISHRIALTYDATQVLLAAIDKGVNSNLQDVDIKEKLPDLIRQLKLTGMTGNITFIPNSSDRQEQLQGLVQPLIDSNGKFKGFKAPE